MKCFLWGVVALVTACGSKTDDFGVQPGGGGGTGGSGGGSAPYDSNTNDGTVIPPDGGISGRVCLATDPRKLTACAATGAGGFRVQLGTEVATTGVDGKFTIATPSGMNLVWSVTGTTIVPSFKVLGDYQIPAITKAAYATMQSTNGPADVPGQGSIMASVIHNTGVAGATAAASPPGSFAPFYDGPNPPVWPQTATGADGTIWVPNLVVGSTSLAVTPSVGATPITVAGIPVEDQAITFVTINTP